MQFDIEVIQGKVETKPTAKGSYQMCELTFKNLNTGKIEARKVMSFTNKEVFQQASGAKTGDVFTVVAEKGDQYWEWKSMTPVAPGAAAPTSAKAPTVAASRSTYETPEERARKQVLIVKQSSVTAAVNILTTGAKSPPELATVLATAQAITDWVMETATPDVFDLPNDIEV